MPEERGERLKSQIMAALSSISATTPDGHPLRQGLRVHREHCACCFLVLYSQRPGTEEVPKLHQALLEAWGEALRQVFGETHIVRIDSTDKHVAMKSRRH